MTSLSMHIIANGVYHDSQSIFYIRSYNPFVYYAQKIIATQIIYMPKGLKRGGQQQLILKFVSHKVSQISCL